MKKYYKVYANCCIAVPTIKEIDKEEAYNYVTDAVYDYYNWEPFPLDDDASDGEINEFYEKMCSAAIAYFEENDFFECGDFIILHEENYPTRGNSYDYSVSWL